MPELTDEIVVAVITAISAVCVAAIPVMLQQRKRQQKVDATLGTPNGHGSIVTMLTHLINGQHDDRAQIEQLKQNSAEHGHTLRVLEIGHQELRKDHRELRELLEPKPVTTGE